MRLTGFCVCPAGTQEKRITFDDLAGAQFLKNTVADGENGDIIEKEDVKEA